MRASAIIIFDLRIIPIIYAGIISLILFLLRSRVSLQKTTKKKKKDGSSLRPLRRWPAGSAVGKAAYKWDFCGRSRFALCQRCGRLRGSRL